MPSLLDGLRRTSRSLLREHRFTVPALLSIALGVGVAISILGLLQLDSLVPPRVSPAMVPEYVRDPGWGTRWNGPLWPASQVQAAHFEKFVDVLVVVAALGFAAACLTVVILELIRASTRSHELALRAAVGASRRRQLRGLLGEGLLLAAVGSLCGLALALVGTHLARAHWPHTVVSTGFGLPPWSVIIGFAFPALGVVPFSIFAAAGVLRRTDLSGVLLSGIDGPGQGELILQDFLATVQLAASIALVVGAGLMVKSAAFGPQSAQRLHDPGSVLRYQLDLAQPNFSQAVERANSYEALLDRVQALADVQAESLTTPGAWLGIGPLALMNAQCGRCYRSGVYVPTSPAYVRLHGVSPGFFRSLGVAVLEGRDFSHSDRVDTPPVMLVNRKFAKDHFERGEPIGRKVQIGGLDDPWYEVVGVVDDLEGRGVGPNTRAVPVAYVSVLQDPPLAVDLLIRAHGDREALAPTVNQTIAGAGITPPARHSIMKSDLDYQAAPIRWIGVMLGLVGALVLMIAVYGTYSVMRFKVSRRRREIGVRRALGAGERDIVRAVVLQSLALTCIGAALGCWAALVLAGWLNIFVPRLQAFDWAVYGGTVLSLSTAALVGGSLPARWAARVHPAVAIRTE